MRQGISRDGHHLYPAHPYPSFAKVGEADLEALYAFLMAEPAVTSQAVPAPRRLRFPFSFRPLMAGWNALFLKAGVIEPDPARSDQWNRGRSLVEGLGHCSACHSPRNLFGAELAGAAHLGGGTVDGWHAPSLTATSLAPLRWTYDEYFAYLRTGASRHHGVAAGPMAEVVAELGSLPDVDLRAMATYLASLGGPAPADDPDALAATLEAEARSRAVSLSGEGARLYDGACAACHEADGTSLYGARAEPGVQHQPVRRRARQPPPRRARRDRGAGPCRSRRHAGLPRQLLGPAGGRPPALPPRPLRAPGAGVAGVGEEGIEGSGPERALRLTAFVEHTT